MEKVCSVRVLGSCATDDETNLSLIRRDMIILKYNHLLSNYSIVIVLTHMVVGVEDTTLVLRLISHSMAGQLTSPVRHPLVCMKFMDQFDYNCCSYYSRK